MFKFNVGMTDRLIRMNVGLVLIALAFVGPQTPWGLLGMIPFVTGLVGTCPLYSLLRLDTCPHGK